MYIQATSRIARWGRLLFLPVFGCSHSHLPDRKILLLIFISISLLLVSSNSHAAAAKLTSDTEVATAGYYQLRWQGNGAHYQLQESPSPAFESYKTIYQGKDLATVISGKPDGEYYYRIHVTDKQSTVSSNIVRVSVAHHPITNAWLFFLAGAVVFIATLFLIIKGNRQHA